jgi:hypothetical protein
MLHSHWAQNSGQKMPFKIIKKIRAFIDVLTRDFFLDLIIIFNEFLDSKILYRIGCYFLGPRSLNAINTPVNSNA